MIPTETLIRLEKNGFELLAAVIQGLENSDAVEVARLLGNIAEALVAQIDRAEKAEKSRDAHSAARQQAETRELRALQIVDELRAVIRKISATNGQAQQSAILEAVELEVQAGGEL